MCFEDFKDKKIEIESLRSVLINSCLVALIQRLFALRIQIGWFVWHFSINREGIVD